MRVAYAVPLDRKSSAYHPVAGRTRADDLQKTPPRIR
jgi:hypothetical protein